MVSSALDMSLDELNAALARLRQTAATDPDYAALRADLPADWPL
jgi:hypothetical protein